MRGGRRLVEAYPLITSSFKSTRPFSTSPMSTFFLQAFLPFREGWLCWRGGSFDPERTPITGILFAEVKYPDGGRKSAWVGIDEGGGYLM